MYFTYTNKIILVWFNFFLGGRWFSKILRNIWGWYFKILTIPYRGGWVLWKRPKTPLRNIKMAPYLKLWYSTFEYFYWTLLAGNQYIAGKFAKSPIFSNFEYGFNINFKMNNSFLWILAKKIFFSRYKALTLNP